MTGTIAIRAQATDGTGELQVERGADPYRGGAMEWHEVIAVVV